MKLATRTGLAATAASVIAVVVLIGVATSQYERSVSDRVDRQLVDRAGSAAVLAAVAERVSVSELSGTVEAARVRTGETVTAVGNLPDGELPELDRPGWRTVDVGDEQWRLYAVEVDGLPRAGDETLVEFAAPLGDVTRQLRRVRRVTVGAGILSLVVASLLGWIFGRRAVRPLVRLRHDTRHVGVGPPSTWAVASGYGNREVDDVAQALNATLDRLAEETTQREQTLVTARAFAATAAHELRSPLQSAMTNLDILAVEGTDPSRIVVIRHELERMGHALTVVNALTQADFVDPSQFERFDLADLADEVVARHADPSVTIEFRGDEHAPVDGWADGVRIALDNLLRNARTHGRPTDDRPAVVHVVVDAATSSVTVDDDGPGIDAADRERLLRAHERGSATVGGSGLGLSLVASVARAHGGDITVSTSPLGGARVTLRVGPVGAPDDRTD